MAELTGCEGVLALLKQIYEVLQEYDQQTDAMINAELEVLQQSPMYCGSLSMPSLTSF